jgi:MFS family permease
VIHVLQTIREAPARGLAWVVRPLEARFAPVARAIDRGEDWLARFRRPLFVVWWAVIVVLVLLRCVELRADFPVELGSRFLNDGFLYSDEGWYSTSVRRWFKTGEWYIPGENNTGLILPMHQVAHAVSFLLMGPTIEGARLTSAGGFVLTCLFTFLLLLRVGQPVWVGMTAVTVMASNFFFFVHSRLAIGELPMMMFVMAAALLATYARGQRAWWVAPLVGVVFLMGMLTKTPATLLGPVIALIIFAVNFTPDRRSWPVAFGAPVLFGIVALGGLFAWQSYIRTAFPADVEFFNATNIGTRSGINWYHTYRHSVWFWKNLEHVDKYLFQYMTLGVALLLILSPRFHRRPAVLLPMLAILIWYALWSYFGNRQLRYFVAMAAPVGILVAMGLGAMWERRRETPLSRVPALVMVLLVMVLTVRGGTKIREYIGDLEYSYAQSAAKVRDLMEERHAPNNALLSHIACAFALYEDFTSVNVFYAAGSLEDRILRFKPHVMVTEWPFEEPDAETVERERSSGEPRDSLKAWETINRYYEVEHVGGLDLLKNNAGRNVQLYWLEPKPDAWPQEAE